MKSQKTILLRVDASEKLGLGHLMRSIALAQGLKKKSVHPFFIIKEAKEADLIADYGFDLQKISQKLNFKEDALRTMDIAAQLNAHAVIVDLSHQSNVVDHINFVEYFRTLKKQGMTLIVFDDYKKIDFAVDIHIIPYYGAEATDYHFSDKTKPLLGLDYFIFREEFIKEDTVLRTIKKSGHNVLVSMGGSDPANVTEKIVESLSDINKSMPLTLKVVLGGGFNSLRYKTVLHQIQKLYTYGTCDVIENAKNMPELMLWSDVVITGGGLIKYEAALTGSPNIIISQKSIEAERCEDYANRTNAAIHLGHFKDFKKDRIARTVVNLLKDYETRQSMSRKGTQLADGKGTQRVINHILEMETALV